MKTSLRKTQDFNSKRIYKIYDIIICTTLRPRIVVYQREITYHMYIYINIYSNNLLIKRPINNTD